MDIDVMQKQLVDLMAFKARAEPLLTYLEQLMNTPPQVTQGRIRSRTESPVEEVTP